MSKSIYVKSNYFKSNYFNTIHVKNINMNYQHYKKVALRLLLEFVKREKPAFKYQPKKRVSIETLILTTILRLH